MGDWGLWACLSVPLFFAVTDGLADRARSVALGAYVRGSGGLCALNTWRAYQHTLRCARRPTVNKMDAQWVSGAA